MPDTVLIVEDEAPVRELLTTWLEEAGYAPRSAANGIEGLREVYQARPDVIVADILMPQMDGFEFCKLVREVTDAPIMFLTGLGEEQRKVEGLNLGADDYIVKPVGMDEFLARIAALLRRRARSQQATGEPRRYADPMLNIDFDRHEARINGQAMDLTPTEFRLLWFLAQHAGRTCSPRDILENVWESPHCSQDVVKWHVASLRAKLEANPRNPRHIITVWGVGYRYDAPSAEQLVMQRDGKGAKSTG